MGDLSKLHVIFDLDDTLYPERQHAHSGFRAAGRHAREAWGVEGLADRMIALLDAGHLGGLFKISIEEHLEDATEDHVKALIDVYRTHDPEIDLFDDAVWALEHYAAKGPLGLITDGNASVQAKKVEALGIAPHFAEIVLTGALGETPREFHKPHPRSYEIIEEKIGAPGDRYVYVGDNPAKDFITPNARGWISVQVVRDRTIHDPHAVADGGEPQHRIRSLRELADVLPE